MHRFRTASFGQLGVGVGSGSSRLAGGRTRTANGGGSARVGKDERQVTRDERRGRVTSRDEHRQKDKSGAKAVGGAGVMGRRRRRRDRRRTRNV